jgi:hypothetical protein
MWRVKHDAYIHRRRPNNGSECCESAHLGTYSRHHPIPSQPSAIAIAIAIAARYGQQYRTEPAQPCSSRLASHCLASHCLTSHCLASPRLALPCVALRCVALRRLASPASCQCTLPSPSFIRTTLRSLQQQSFIIHSNPQQH